MKIKHYRGTHFSTPLWTNVNFPRKTKNNNTFLIRFGEGCEYCKPGSIGDEDLKQDCYDWSKLIGLSYAPYYNSRKNSIMLGWRYNKATSRIQGTCYWHDEEGTPHYQYMSSIMTFKKDHTYRVTFHDYHITVTDEQGKQHILRANKKSLNPTKRCVKINTWFGGNRAAPNKMSFDITKIKV